MGSFICKKGSKIPISYFPLRWGGMTPKFYPACKNNKADMSRWNSVPGLSPPASPPHKGHQSSAETAPSRGLSVSAWVEICVCVCVRAWAYGGEEAERHREGAGEVLTGQFQVAGPDGQVWPLIPPASVQKHACHTSFYFFPRSPFFFRLSQTPSD